MQKIAVLFVAAGGFFLGGCSSHPVVKTEPDKTTTSIEASLNAAAQSAAVSLSELSRMEQAKHPGMDNMPFPDVNDRALNQLIFVRWYGPIEPLLSMVAVKVGYQLQVFGQVPSLPVLVDIDDANSLVPAINILRNASVQSGVRTKIEVYTDRKIISLRYF